MHFSDFNKKKRKSWNDQCPTHRQSFKKVECPFNPHIWEGSYPCRLLLLCPKHIDAKGQINHRGLVKDKNEKGARKSKHLERKPLQTKNMPINT